MPFTPYQQQHVHQQRPPMLSFRSFHEKHFSPSQRQAFFSGIPNPWFPVPSQTFQQTEDQELEQGLEESVHPTAVKDGEAGTVNNNNAISLQLSKEAIEIFEFSRRFRQEKERAAQVEKTRIKKRRIKRRKLTKRGFAFDEGNSGTEDSDNTEIDDRSGGIDMDERQLDGDVGSGRDEEDKDGDEDGDEDDDEAGEDSDFEVSRMEPPATDVSFLNQGSRRNERTRQQLYGQDRGASLNTIEMLEGILNQTYVDSLGSQVFTAETTDIDREANNPRGPRYRRKNESRNENRTRQVVYWPGVPLRC